MGTIKHHKKRNAGLLYEFLTRVISNYIVDGNEKKANVALNVLKRHFAPGTELYREFRLLNSLVKTTVSNNVIAASIISESKLAARTHNVSKLNREKDKLIAVIEGEIKDSDFYDRHIQDYKAYATAQSLLNEWRRDHASIDISSIAKFEDYLCEWLTKEKANETPIAPSGDSPGADRLIMKVMMNKLNEKYGDSLSTSQKQLIKSYVFSTAKDDPGIIKERLLVIKGSILESIESHCGSSKPGDYLWEKLKTIREMVNSESLSNVTDDTLTRFMLYTKLNDELNSKE